jgi:hypothetical protein
MVVRIKDPFQVPATPCSYWTVGDEIAMRETSL